MKIEHTQISGFNAAIRGMRNPMNSWNLSDTDFSQDNNHFIFGEKDNELAKKLIKAGKDHRKFLRLIHISVDLTLPRYIWTELDTYKVSTVRASCSTMHKLGSEDLVPSDFQDENVLENTLYHINELAKRYRDKKEVSVLRDMKQILPEGFLQKATFDMNYETAIAIYFGRKNHRMIEWTQEICPWIKSLPMMEEWLEIIIN